MYSTSEAVGVQFLAQVHFDMWRGMEPPILALEDNSINHSTTATPNNNNNQQVNSFSSPTIFEGFCWEMKELC